MAHPEIGGVFLAAHQVLEGDAAVGDKVVGRDGRVVEDGEAEREGVVHVVHEVLVPYGVEGLRLGRRPVEVVLVDVYRHVRVDRLVVRFPERRHGVVPLLEVRRTQPARFAYLHTDRAREHLTGRRRLGHTHTHHSPNARPTASRATNHPRHASTNAHTK